MNTFLKVLTRHNLDYEDNFRRGRLTTLQVNMGNLCNQSCEHCHVNASPQGEKVMSKEVVDAILQFLSRVEVETLDITGGAPELNPNFEYFVQKAKALVKELIVRTNLTVIFEPGKEHLPEFYRSYKVHLICSLPCYQEQNVDAQRGRGVFKKSIQALTILNDLGYAKDSQLLLDLVYNPVGAELPPAEDKLELEYRKNLGEKYGLEFNRLLTLTNVPIRRFEEKLRRENRLDGYLQLLKDSFNPLTVENLMCKHFLSIGYDGKIYDCDFNQSLGWAWRDERGEFLTIDKLEIAQIESRQIMVGEHCLSCTAGYGSSCQGAIEKLQIADYKLQIREYYSKVLKSKQDLKTSACCSPDSLPRELQKIMPKIVPEIKDKFYGCGSPIPPLLSGCRVLDLGCGTGRDVYLTSYLVGEDGFVLGVDMTLEQLEVARKYLELQMQKFGFSRINVEFKQGYIEDLKSIGIEGNSFDLVISNCVINLSLDKKAVFSEIFRVLKPGGELYFSDIFADRRVPEEFRDDPILLGECLAGALYIEDFRRILREIGCLDYRIVSKRKIKIDEPEIERKVGMINFYSLTVRAFKLELEDRCEDYGQLAIYLGGIPEFPHRFILDDHHIFEAGKPVAVCGNTADMLSRTRYGRYFKIIGDKSRHFGLFNCNALSIIETDYSFNVCCY